MTFDEAISLLERIKDTAIGSPIKGKPIQSLFIAPTCWEEMHIFMTARIQKGEDEAVSDFIGKSFSVYGVSISYIAPDIPKWEMTILDDWEKTIYN